MLELVAFGSLHCLVLLLVAVFKLFSYVFLVPISYERSRGYSMGLFIN